MANVFRSNRSQAVRLPKAAEFPPDVTEVEVVVDGDRRVLVPVAHRSPKTFKQFFESGPFLTDDFPDEIPDTAPAHDVSFDD